MRIRRGVVIKTVVFGLFFAVFWITGSNASNIYKDLELLGQSLTIVKDMYVDRVELSVLVENALRGMVESLDQHSTYLDVDERRFIEEEAEGRFGGVGIVIGLRRGRLTVVSPIEGSPAQRAGLRPLDVITEINRHTTLGIGLRRAILLLRGDPGDTVSLVVQRPGIGRPMEYDICRAVIEIPRVPYAFHVADGGGGRVGYIRLASFTKNADESLRNAAERLRGKECVGFVIDLRGNPGGLLEQAVKVADLFLAVGDTICYTIGRKGTERADLISQEPPILDGTPIVALIDEGSASGAEIVAGALQDNDRAVLIGRQTYGKGTVQELREFGDGTALKITTARWFTPAGFCIDGELGLVDTTRNVPDNPIRTGIAPNILISPTSDAPWLADLEADVLPQFVTYWTAEREPPAENPAAFRPAPDLLDSLASWIERHHPLAESEPDSAAELAQRSRQGDNDLLGRIGAELARSWWGAEGAAQFMCHTDSTIVKAVAFAGDMDRFNDALTLPPQRAPRDSLFGQGGE
jgi:carboxyl-terminal processing protease